MEDGSEFHIDRSESYIERQKKSYIDTSTRQKGMRRAILVFWYYVLRVLLSLSLILIHTSS